ncbi:hypothetical protein [Enterobacter hormaechei]|uniref:hypothetical protein n=1 Tax=Enterobacter hormaechei TaxID=158836 RepID=UPI00123884A3|nr:hypothetical protein [Enterobacter hormaechei]MDH1746152.1 hypothetical protein [Enterobacter hormaechei]HDT2483015.1 hypothetical protein [Enterobacter hormaechei subsp. steigerwaltii]HEC4724207.1 hypothetical protein [Enterobacter hormaechei]
MECKVSELVKIGHERAADLRAACGTIAVAKLISDLATQLDVQLARSNELAAENAGLKAAIDATIGWQQSTDPENVESVRMLVDVKTPATDAFLAEVRAQGVEMLAKETEKLEWHESTVRFVLRFAAQIRKGAQS